MEDGVGSGRRNTLDARRSTSFLSTRIGFNCNYMQQGQIRIERKKSGISNGYPKVPPKRVPFTPRILEGLQTLQRM